MARIISVDDDELISAAVSATLTADGHLVGVIRNGALALETIRFKRPDLVILDCALPGLPGIEVLRCIRCDPQIYLMPVLMLTGHRRERDLDSAWQAGANGYIIKPFEAETLRSEVARILATCDLRRAAN